ncbi:hypothetical protein N7510_006757 [Penicillium lagena]|uniref:uncharacterized protein n=1 Tax=Penicillium lagena TaxID=94218 RepID=UPI002540578B|nr:uncharacterized protein N7510_006757 [Penicillium lagena]KAJ5610038.1 hypothetical protein N7510_006757 [Penicillium lagena]
MEELAPLEPFGECYDVFSQLENSQNETAEKVAQCKRLARDIKSKRATRGNLPADIHRSFPSRQVMDELVELYFATFESCFRILYLPSFRADYESYTNQPETAKDHFLLRLLLVMILAGTIHDDSNVRNDMATKSSSWIYIAQTWLSAPLEKNRLKVEGIQIHCLLLLARQVTRVGTDLVWISAGSLTRMAMQMGFHQDPNRFEEMSTQQKEIRRRLWYTILELNVQAALDSGMSPMIRDEDYNTQPPSNVNDNDLDEGNPEEHPTHVSFQPVLASSLPLRLRVTRVINSLQEESSYEQVLAIGNELAQACRDAATEIEHAASMNKTAKFASSYCSHLLRRFPLCLHFSYAITAQKNPLYSYSQKVCLAAAQDIVSLLEDVLYRRLLLAGGGMFRDIITRGALLIFLGLCPEPEGDISFFPGRDRNRKEPLLQDGRRVVQYAKDRMWYGETNVKVYVCLNMMLAQAESRLYGKPSKEAILKVLHESLDTCHELFQTRSSTNPMDPGTETWPFGGMEMPLLADFDTDFDFLGDSFDLGFSDSLFPQ